MHVFILDDMHAANSGHINKIDKKLGPKEKMYIFNDKLAWTGTLDVLMI